MTTRTRLSTSTRRTTALVASTLGATLLLGLLPVGPSMTVRVAHAQKKGGNPPPPPAVLPPARYTLEWIDGVPGWGTARPKRINVWGEIAGTAFNNELGNSTSRTAFAHTAAGATVNLNDLDADWYDLNAAVPTLTGGWWANTAQDINDQGVIVGTAANINSGLPERAYVLEDAFGAAPRFLLLPTTGVGSSYRVQINNHGDAVGSGDNFALIRYLKIGDVWPYYVAVRELGITTDGVFDINDDGVVVARRAGVSSTVSYRQLAPGAPSTAFSGLEFWSISNGAIPRISGYRTGKKGLAGGPMRMPALGTVNDVQILYSSGLYARALNDEGDTVFEPGGRPFLYYDAFIPGTSIRYGTNGDGVLPLDQMVVNPDADWLEWMRQDGIANRDGTDLGAICGRTSFRGFVLRPFVP